METETCNYTKCEDIVHTENLWLADRIVGRSTDDDEENEQGAARLLPSKYYEF